MPDESRWTAGPSPDLLYHYTCRHQATGIRTTQIIIPGTILHGQKILGSCFAWFTDLAPPVPREAVGLTSTILRCDRTEIVFTVNRHDAHIRRWVDISRQYPELRELEQANGALPMHWYVSRHPVAIVGAYTDA